MSISGARLIHRPDCVSGKRSPLCACQKLKEKAEAPSRAWKDWGFESKADYDLWLKRISVRGPWFKSGVPGGHKTIP